MKTPIFVYLCWSCFAFAQAQTQKIDSLNSALQHVKNDIDKAQSLNAMADAYKTTNPKVMQQYAAQALALSQKKSIQNRRRKC